MTYQVFARKWRPKNLDSVVGQDLVRTALTQAINNQRVHHAYLFSGTRGCGKTTFARLLAKALNCAEGPTSSPCGVCTACEQINAGQCPDVFEVDAASRTKVEETRDLLENVPYAPVSCRTKVYIIDEVHMLSQHSFNALLKTLEEPPEHVKFLLATTDPDKLPVTILSRCLQYHLKPISVPDIQGQLSRILNEEKLSAEPDSLMLLAQAARGSLRDALSLLEQALAYEPKGLTSEGVRTMLGWTGHQQLPELLECVLSGDVAKAIALVQTFQQSGVNFTALLDAALRLIHAVSLTQWAPETAVYRDIDPDTLTQLSEKASPESWQLMYQLLLDGKRDMALAPEPGLGFEMLILRAVAFQPARRSPGSTPVSAPSRPTSAPPVKKVTTQRASKPTALSREPKEPAAPTKASPAQATSAATAAEPNWLDPQSWATWSSALPLSGIQRMLVQHCVVESKEGARLCLRLDPKQSACLSPERIKQIEAVMQKQAGTTLQLDIAVKKEAAPLKNTPQQLADAKAAKAASTAKQAVESDPHIQAVLETFDGTIEHIEPQKEADK